MATQIFSSNSPGIYNMVYIHQFQTLIRYSNSFDLMNCGTKRRKVLISSIRCSVKPIETLRTCKNCKTQFNPSQNNTRACRYHTAHFGGETKRKFESVHSGGTMSTPESGKISQYWHCCGSEDPFDPGCTAAPHFSYDD